MVYRKRSQKPRKQGAQRAHPCASDRSPDQPHSPWIYGHHAVSAALSNPARTVRRFLATKEAAVSLHLAENGPQVEIVSRDEIETLLPPGAVHQGLALLAAALQTVSVEELADRASQCQKMLVVALDQVTDPQNVGGILRSAAAFGASALLVPERHTPDKSGALAKAASGALEAVPVVRLTNLVRALNSLKADGFWVVGLDVDAPQLIGAPNLPEKCILVLGAEGKGLRRLTRETCDLLVKIAITGEIQSLNVSASAAVALYEWARQHP